MLTHVDLFSGIGGFALAAGWAGFRTVVFCEIDEFCQAVLKERFGAVADPEGREAQPSKSSRLHAESCSKIGKPILIPDIRDFDGSRWKGATLLTGGFPCQPFSHAGKRKGKADDRAIWPEMLRVIKEARPTWVVGENVSGIISMELDQVLSDLEMEGYTCRTFHIGAVAVNAPHRRMRVWIVAHAGGTGAGDRCRAIGNEGGRVGQDRGARLRQDDGAIVPNGIAATDSDAPNASGEGLPGDVCGQFGGLSEQVGGSEGSQSSRGITESERWQEPWLEVATRLCRVDARVSNRVDRLKALGNAIVPQIAHEIIKGIAEIENEKTHT